VKRPKGETANVHYKVCDEGIYWFEDTEGNEIHKIECYVPELFDYCNDSYGDHIIMTTDENGHIEEWYNTDEYQSTEDAALFQDQLRKECGLAFCTKHDCINEFNTDFRTFDIKEIHD
jgi:hypothetical protein